MKLINTVGNILRKLEIWYYTRRAKRIVAAFGGVHE